MLMEHLNILYKFTYFAFIRVKKSNAIPFYSFHSDVYLHSLGKFAGNGHGITTKATIRMRKAAVGGVFQLVFGSHCKLMIEHYLYVLML